MYWNICALVSSFTGLMLNSNIRCIEILAAVAKTLQEESWIVTLDVLK